MAVTWVDRNLTLASAGDGVDGTFMAESITIRASADTWAVVLKDKDGIATKFDMASDISNNRGGTFDIKGTVFYGCVLTTATDITSVRLSGTRHIPISSIR